MSAVRPSRPGRGPRVVDLDTGEELVPVSVSPAAAGPVFYGADEAATVAMCLMVRYPKAAPLIQGWVETARRSGRTRSETEFEVGRLAEAETERILGRSARAFSLQREAEPAFAAMPSAVAAVGGRNIDRDFAPPPRKEEEAVLSFPAFADGDGGDIPIPDAVAARVAAAQVRLTEAQAERRAAELRLAGARREAAELRARTDAEVAAADAEIAVIDERTRGTQERADRRTAELAVRQSTGIDDVPTQTEARQPQGAASRSCSVA
ncbi:MAG: hypothetical protein LBF24_04050 [Puniceicoccales bacterium]|nr:hypothetical protein [Puniceicoccales bacterium]